MEFFLFLCVCFGLEGWSCHGWDGAGRNVFEDVGWAYD